MLYKRDTTRFSQIIEDPFYCKDPALYEIFKKCQPPKESYLYFPKGNELIIPNNEKPENSIRKTYYNVPYLDFEKKWLKELKEIIKNHPENHIPRGWDDSLSLASIYAGLGDIEFSYEIIIDYLDWWDNTFPMEIKPNDHCMELLNNGFLYIYGRDHQYKPIIICQPYILQAKLDYFTNEDIMKASIFLCQFAVNNMLIPGQIENWVMFFNLDGTSLLSLPEPIKNLVQELSDNFSFRLYKCYVKGMSFLMRILYKFVCNFIGQPDEDKIVILEGDDDPRLFNDFNSDNLEERFGGNAPNLEYGEQNGLFPPRMPTNNFLKPDEDPHQVLVSESEYIFKCKKGLIPKDHISPFISQSYNIPNINIGINLNNNFDKINFGNASQRYNNTDYQSNKMTRNNLCNQLQITQRQDSINSILRANYVPFSKSMSLNKANSNNIIIKYNSIENKNRGNVQQLLKSINWKINDELNSENIVSKKLRNSNKYMSDLKNFNITKGNFSESLYKLVQ